MFAKLLLYISSQSTTVAYWRSGKPVSCQEFSNDESGWSDFSALLRTYQDTPVYIMVDVVEEDLRCETLPHASGTSRQEMLARKLKQIYRSTPYSGAGLQGRSSGKRQDDIYLFSALTNPGILSPWLNALQFHHAPLAGIYLLSMVSQLLISQLKITAPNLLLITRNSAGLRQSFFQHQQLKASRLTLPQFSDEMPEQPASGIHPDISFYTDEIEKTRFYLNSQRLLHRDDKLNICILDTDNSLTALQAALDKDAALHCTRIKREELCSRLGIPSHAIPSFCNNAPHFIALGTKPPLFSLGPTSLIHDFNRYRARHALHAFSATVLSGAIIWSGANFYLQQKEHRQTKLLALQTSQLETQYQNIARQFPAAPVSADNLLKAVNLATQLGANGRTPEQLMAITSHALDASPTVTLTKLKWVLSPQSDTPDDAAKSSQPIPSGPPLQNTAPGQKWQIGYLEGEITPFNGDYRSAISDIEAFANRLKQDAAIGSVTIQQLPLDINSSSGLSGTTLEKEHPASNARFKIKLLLRQGL